MRRLLAWIAGAAGGLAAYRLATRRRGAPVPEPPAEADPRAAELRAKLEEARTAPAAEPPLEVEPEAELSDPEERRRDVHERGRAAVDEMRRSPGASEKP